MKVESTTAFDTVVLISIARKNGLVLDDTVIVCAEIETGKEGICGIDLSAKDKLIGVFYHTDNLDKEPRKFTKEEFNKRFAVLSIGAGF